MWVWICSLVQALGVLTKMCFPLLHTCTHTHPCACVHTRTHTHTHLAKSTNRIDTWNHASYSNSCILLLYCRYYIYCVNLGYVLELFCSWLLVTIYIYTCMYTFFDGYMHMRLSASCVFPFLSLFACFQMTTVMVVCMCRHIKDL